MIVEVGSRVRDRADRYKGSVIRCRGEGRVSYVYPNPRFVRIQWDDGTTTERVIENVEVISPRGEFPRSAPVLVASQNIAERDPSVMPDCAGVDAIGKYQADYSHLTPEEIAQDDFELVELYANSSPIVP